MSAKKSKINGVKMKLKAYYLITLFCLLFMIPGFAQDINAGISIGSEGLKSFYFSISNYYNVPEAQVERTRERRIHDEELPVVFFIAGKAGVNPQVIIDLRLGGSSWYDISVKYGIYSNAYYVPLESHPGPPYGKAYGHYKNKPRKEWGKIRLSDEDIINLVNLKFISEYYNYKPEKIIEMRKEGKRFAVISNDIKAEKKENKKHGNGKEKSKKKN